MNKINNIKYEISVNSFGKIEKPILNIKLEKKIVFYLNHSKKYFKYNKPNGQIFNYVVIKHFKPNVFYDKKSIINIVEINDLISIYDKENNRILIVKILSEIKTETSKYIKIIKEVILSCNKHKIIYKGCENCENSILEIINIKYNFYKQYLNERYSIEDFYCCYRDIEIIKDIVNVKKFNNNNMFSIQSAKYNKI